MICGAISGMIFSDNSLKKIKLNLNIYMEWIGLKISDYLIFIPHINKDLYNIAMWD